MILRLLFLIGLVPAIVLAQGSGTETPPPALDGYCPVCIVKSDKLVKGSAAFSSDYDGKKYLFPSATEKKVFDENPAAFAPAMGGNCVVCKVEMKKDVPGKAEIHLVHKGRLYLFPAEAQLKTFKEKAEKYADADIAMNGFCAVCKVDMGKEVKGKPEFAFDYRGARYLFPAKEQLDKFRQNPKKYAQK
ncbi:MAG: YHS domain-containing protein [Planctomycetota bacterium]